MTTPLTLTPGTESRLDGAPGVDLDREKFMLLYQSYLDQGMGVDEAGAAAERDVAAEKAKRRQEAMAAEQRAAATVQREFARSGDPRSNAVLMDENAYAQEQADTITGGYRSDGPRLVPGSPAGLAEDRMRALDDLPFQSEASPDPVNDERTIRADFERRFGRPPRTEADMQLSRDLMIREYQTDFGNRNVAQAPGRWGTQEPFESQYQMDQYEESSPGQPSELEADMMASDTPMILESKPGGAGPQIAAPGPGIANEAFGQPARRLDLEERGFVPTAVQGPSGEQYAYKLSPEAQAEATRKRDAFLYEQRMDRLARRSGRSYADVDETLPLPAELQGGDDMAMRQLKRDARRGYEDEKAARLVAARDRRTTLAQYRNAGVPASVALLPEADRAEAIRGLLPMGRGQISNLDAAKLAVERDAVAARQAAVDGQIAQGNQQFQAQMAEMRAEAERDRLAAEERRRQWKADYEQREAARDDRMTQWLGEQEAARDARAMAQEDRREDRKSREGDPARRAAAEDDLEQRQQARDEKQKADRRELEMEMQQLAIDRTKYGEGILQIMDGEYGTPEAQESLRRIATDSDKSWFGYYESDAHRMDATLFRLGVVDPEVRHGLVQQYGVNVSGGRGSWLGRGYNALMGIDYPSR